MNIPIQNIYYLLCYAWDKLEESNIVNVSGADTKSLLDLLARVLVNATRYLFKRGLDRSYLARVDSIHGLKGKFLISDTLKRNEIIHKQTICEFDELEFNNLHNQIIRTTLIKLLRFRELDLNIRDQIRQIVTKFPGVDEIIIKPTVFKKVNLNRNNYFYRFALNVCEIIHHSILVDEKTGDFYFRDFTRDEEKMALLFEAFVRNFFKREVKEFKVTRENLQWDFHPVTPSGEKFLPQMQTDITLQSPRRKIIIDTKYKQETLQRHHEVEKIHSSNLYQLFAYIKNAEKIDRLGPTCEGILLYAAAGRKIRLEFRHEHHKIKVCTLDLNQDWRGIDGDLRGIIE